MKWDLDFIDMIENSDKEDTVGELQTTDEVIITISDDATREC
jgi:hypothetical protein